MTARRDPLEVVDDMLRNAALARDFLPPDATPDTLDQDARTLYSIVRASRSWARQPSGCPIQ